MDEINTGKVNIFDAKPKIDEPKHLKDLFKRMITKLNRKVVVLLMKFPSSSWMLSTSTEKVEQRYGKCSSITKISIQIGHRIDPLIPDLNKDGKFDITGATKKEMER